MLQKMETLTVESFELSENKDHILPLKEVNLIVEEKIIRIYVTPTHYAFEFSKNKRRKILKTELGFVYQRLRNSENMSKYNAEVVNSLLTKN